MARRTNLVQSVPYFKFRNLFYRHLVDRFGQEFGPPQGLHPHSTTQTQKQKVLGRSNHLRSFDATWITQKTKKSWGEQRHTEGPLPSNDRTNTQTARRPNKSPKQEKLEGHTGNAQIAICSQKSANKNRGDKQTDGLVGSEWSASYRRRFILGDRGPCTRWTGGCVDPRAGLDAVGKKFLTLPGLKLRPPSRPASRYIDCTIPASLDVDARNRMHSGSDRVCNLWWGF
jgi:hypothetical protein